MPLCCTVGFMWVTVDTIWIQWYSIFVSEHDFKQWQFVGVDLDLYYIYIVFNYY